nr:hypothetical protein [Tanacetum cinerariifolium]
VRPEVPDVPKYTSESKEESWTFSQDDKDDVEESDMNDDKKEKADDDEVSSNQRVYTSPEHQLIDEEENQEGDDEVKEGEEEQAEEEMYRDLNINLQRSDAKMTDAQQEHVQANQVTEDIHVILTTVPPAVQQQSSSVSSDFVSKFINPSLDSGIDSILSPNIQSETLVNVLVFVVAETPSSDTTIPQPPIPNIKPLQQTPKSTTPTTIPTTTLPNIPKFASLFQFDQHVSALETKMSEFRQTNLFAEAISLIPGIVDNYLASKMKDAIDVPDVDESQWNPSISLTPYREWHNENRPPQPWITQMVQAAGTQPSFNEFLATTILNKITTVNMGFAAALAVLVIEASQSRQHDTSSNEMVAIDGAGFDWIFMADDEVPTNMALMAFLDFETIEVKQPEFESCRPKSCEIESKNASAYIPNKLKEYLDAPLVKDRVLDNKDCSVKSSVVVEKKADVHTIAKVKFVRPKQQKNSKETVRLTAITIKGKGWNMDLRAVLLKIGLRPHNTARLVNTAHPKTTVYCARPMLRFSKSAQSTVKRPYQQRTSLTNKSFSQIVNTARPRPVNTARPRPVNTARPNSAVVNSVIVNQVNAVKAMAKVTIVNGEEQIQALVDKKKVIIIETRVRSDLHLEDVEGTECLPTAIIFEHLTLMRYENLTQKLTFYKAFFLPQ